MLTASSGDGGAPTKRRRARSDGEQSRARILQAIHAYAADHDGVTPTYRQLEALTGLSRSNIGTHVRYLVEHGALVRRTDTGNDGIALPPGGEP